MTANRNPNSAARNLERGLRALRSNLGLILVAITAMWIGLKVGAASGSAPMNAAASEHSDHAESTEATWWTCSMHPQVKLPKPGPCPLCKMDLIPLTMGGSDARPRHIRISAADRIRMKIQTSAVERRAVEATIRMAGKIAYDETRIETITARAAGRIDRLFVDYTGVDVQAGDHLVELFSPKLYAAQAELLQALEARSQTTEARKESAQATLDASRERLRQLGLTPAQVEDVESRGTPSDTITLYATQSGIVLHKNVRQGVYVDEGTQIVTIADLGHLWVMLDAYESDLAWLRYGQSVEFNTPAYPGESFKGTIAFIDPTLTDSTRTVKVRVNVENIANRLKPNMFVSAIVRPTLAAGGRVISPEHAGTHICPMHPEIVASEPGKCSQCGMDLVTIASRGYVEATSVADELPLVIPTTAALTTGKRAIVFVEVEGGDRPEYEGREVTLGARAGDWYLVLDGLAENERVVTHGNFKLDSALQIMAQPSMMSAPAEPSAYLDTTPELRAALDGEWAEYSALHAALAGDDMAAARKSMASVHGALNALHSVAASKPARKAVHTSIAPALESLASLESEPELAALRVRFEPVATATGALVRAFGLPGQTVHEMHCPMALGEGAKWVQSSPDVQNPYYGDSMFDCGSLVETLYEASEASDE